MAGGGATRRVPDLLGSCLGQKDPGSG